MYEPLQRATLFALYQLTVLTGIVLLPVALAARRVGVPLPMHRVMRALQRAYEAVDSENVDDANTETSA